MLVRAASFGFIPPALPSPAERVPIGGEWIHEIKHDGYRMMVRRDASGVRLLTRCRQARTKPSSYGKFTNQISRQMSKRAG
jgi:ATP-dependent DNA ligase